MKEQSLEDRLKELQIVSFECGSLVAKNDVMASLDAISAHIKKNSDKDSLAHIEKLKQERKARQNIATMGD